MSEFLKVHMNKILVIVLFFLTGCVNQDENYYLLDEVPWSLKEKKYDSLESFYNGLKKYNIEIDYDLPDYIDSELGFKEVTIIYKYSENINHWISSTGEIKLKSSFDSFSELELLYQLHNGIQQHYKDSDKHYFEGLELEQETPELKFSLVLGS